MVNLSFFISCLSTKCWNLGEAEGWAMSLSSALTANLWLRPKTSASLSSESSTCCFLSSFNSKCLPRPLTATLPLLWGTSWLILGVKVCSYSSRASFSRLAWAMRSYLAFSLALRFSLKLPSFPWAYSDLVEGSIKLVLGLKVQSSVSLSSSSFLIFSLRNSASWLEVRSSIVRWEAIVLDISLIFGWKLYFP